MLTENRLLLVVSNYEENDKAFREEFSFEALKVITSAEEIEPTWNCNKTPLMLKKHLTKGIKEKYPILEVPDFIFGKEHFIQFCHSHGFECGEYVSGKKFNTSEEKCFLCEIVNYRGIKGPLYRFNQLVKDESDIIIYDSFNFFCKIELGCMKKGMLMICPKNHVLSAANIPDKHMKEYQQIMRDIEFILKSVYGDEPVIFFEHGSAPNGFSSHKRSIVHAHTHVAWGVRFEPKYLDMVCLQPSELKDLKDFKYFSYQEGSDGELLSVYDPEVYVQRQYPRQVIGQMLGIDNEKTNWRKEPFADNMTATFHDLYHFLKDNRQFLSERIVKATEGFVKGYPLRYDFVDE